MSVRQVSGSRLLIAPLAAIVLARVADSQSLTIPDTQNTFDSSYALVFPPTPGTVQLLYDPSHFTNAGVTGPVTITRLRFRAGDGVANGGGQSYAGVTVRLGNAAVGWSAMSPTYAANRAAMGPLSTPFGLTLAAVSGSWTNDFMADIDLAAVGAVFTYNPIGSPGLLIEMTFPAAPTSVLTLMPAAASGSPASAHRARANAGPIIGPGTVSDQAAVVRLDFTGPGGYAAPRGWGIENIGAACAGNAASFYQFNGFPGDQFDLRGSPGLSLLLTPDVAGPAQPSFYTVTRGTTAPDLSAAALGSGPPNTTDEGVVTATASFVFRFPGGSTTTFSACVNGYVWLGSNIAADRTPLVSTFLGSMARIAVAWRDHHAGRNLATHPSSGMYVHEDTVANVLYATWREVGGVETPQSGVNVNTFQCAIFANGNVELRYGAINGMRGGPVLTGFSRGGTSAVPCNDPGNRDLSLEVPFATRPEGVGSNLTLGVTGPPALGVPTAFGLVHTVANLPPTTVVAAVLIDFGRFTPSAPLPLGNPGCLQTVAVPNVLASAVLPPATWATPALTLPLGVSPNAFGWMGTPIYTQGVTLNVDALGNLTTGSTNALRLVLGLQ